MNAINLDVLGEVTSDEAFMAELAATDSYEAFCGALAEKGVDINGIDVEDAEGELSVADLDNVAGGLSKKDLARIVKASWKIVKKGPIKGAWTFGKSCGVLLRAYYDTVAHNNPTRSYSEKEIMKAAKALGCV